MLPIGGLRVAGELVRRESTASKLAGYTQTADREQTGLIQIIRNRIQIPIRPRPARRGRRHRFLRAHQVLVRRSGSRNRRRRRGRTRRLRRGLRARLLILLRLRRDALRRLLPLLGRRATVGRTTLLLRMLLPRTLISQIATRLRTTILRVPPAATATEALTVSAAFVTTMTLAAAAPPTGFVVAPAATAATRRRIQLVARRRTVFIILVKRWL